MTMMRTRTSIIAITLAALMAGIYYAGYSHGTKSADAVLAEVNAQLSKQQMENELLAARQRDVVESAGSQFADVRNSPVPVIRVRQQADCRGSKVPAAAAHAAKPEPATVEPGLSTGLDAPGTFQGITVSATRCEEIANRAVIDAAHVLWLQDAYLSISEGK